MNNLESYIKLKQLAPVKVMNNLQDHGIVSDNAIGPEDVANSGEALRWLWENPKGNK